MALKVIEEKGEGATFDWEKVAATFELETKDLPKDDRRYFESIVKFLLGSKIRLSNLKEHHLYYFMEHAEWILTIMLYPMLFYKEYYRKETALYMNELGLPLSIEALGYKYGPMSYQFQHVKQEVVTPEGVVKRGK